MKVFISWSGERSLEIAKGLREWLPRVVQAIEPWMSDSDIDKGIRWEQTIGSELEKASFGIFCLTPENLDARWINFEAGAIAKTVEKTYVCTYLLDLKPTDIEGPLSHFNHTKAEKEDTRKLIHTINRALETQAVEDQILNDAFDVYWPRLEERINQLPPATEKKSPRNVDEMTEEILISVRALLKERSKNSRPSDNFILAFLPLLRAAAQTDPNLQLPPHLMSAIHDLEADATQNRFAELWGTHPEGIPTFKEYLKLAWQRAEKESVSQAQAQVPKTGEPVVNE